MPTEIKPLFRPEAIRPHLASIALPPANSPGREKLEQWAKLLASPAVNKQKETELLQAFFQDIFKTLLGYVGQPAENYTLKHEALVKVDGKFADAALGHFGPNQKPNPFIAAIEGKGPRDPLDRPFAGRTRSAVEQALQYAVQLRIDWYLVTNLHETRLYNKGFDTFTCERFDIQQLASNEKELRRFLFLLGAERVLGSPANNHENHLVALLAESKKIGRELTNTYYADYRALRESTFSHLRSANPALKPEDLLAATQKILDRVLFIAFCEDRGLLPAGIIARAFQQKDDFNPRPIWHNFNGLFRSVDKGNEALNIWKYNGGLFAKDDFLDKLEVPDPVCEGFKKLAEYEYGYTHPDDEVDGKLIDVEILGHIFEQSITDLEELRQASIAQASHDTPAPAKDGPSKRKKEGAFYTPEFVTRYIVAETLGPVLRDKFETFRLASEAAAPKTLKKLFADPAAFDETDLSKSQTAALLAFWEGWLDQLKTVRIVDPSCGSGAFLMEAFNQMFAAYDKAQGYINSLREATLFDIRKTILTQNLFGMDLNAEAVEIARLSCWIKTAEVGKELTTLDKNIQQGNSVVVEPSPLEGWRKRFAEVFADGGFDVVIGNPPYVRQEWIKDDKPYLEKHYRAFDGVADLYVYFYELGLTVLKPGGRLGFIVTNKWMKAGYGENLRKLYAESAWLEQVVDFGHAKQIFPDADVFPCILVARKPMDAAVAPENVSVCVIPRDQLRIDDLSVQIVEEGVAVPRSRLSEMPWNLDPPGVLRILQKMKTVGVPVKKFVGMAPLLGIKTGFNDAFLIDTATKDRLIAADPKSATLFQPYFRGQDISRWHAENVGLSARGKSLKSLKSTIPRWITADFLHLRPLALCWVSL